MPVKKSLPQIKLYNTLTRKKEVFLPLKNEVRLYTCGPTVYDYAHIGNLRTYIFEDLLRRVLEYAGFAVKHVMNITDVGHLTSDADTGEDKMVVGAARDKKTVWEIADFYTNAFKEDMEKLHIKPPSVWCKATEHVNEMIELIRTLEKKGYTYRIADGIYFDTSKLKDYGKLARLKARGIKAGARVEMVKGKKNPTDFALWKFSMDKKRQMEWQSPWNVGFPGWHIECSAMSMKYLGQIDIHCGGVDHVAVHHTNEIAQSEAATGKPFVRFWLHGEFMLVEGKKMAKSLGNYYRLQDLTAKFDPLAFRYLCTSTHYRSQLNFTLEALKNAEKTLESINDFFSRVEEEISLLRSAWIKKSEKKAMLVRDEEMLDTLKQGAIEIETWLYDDLNTPEALSSLFNIIHTVNRMMDHGEIDLASLEFIRGFVLRINEIFQFLKQKEELTETEKKLVEEREHARKRSDFKKADYLRERLRKMGVLLEDTPHGTRWKKISNGKAT